MPYGHIVFATATDSAATKLLPHTSLSIYFSIVVRYKITQAKGQEQPNIGDKKGPQLTRTFKRSTKLN
jgi:hypothetical protein